MKNEKIQLKKERKPKKKSNIKSIRITQVVKMVFGTLLVTVALGIVWYFVGFLSALLRAADLAINRGQPFSAPAMDIVSIVAATMNWNYTQIALIVVGIIALIIAIMIIKTKIQGRRHDERNFDVSDKGTYGTATYLDEKTAKKLKTADNKHDLLSVCSDLQNEDGVILGKTPFGKIITKKSIPKENMNIFVDGAPGSGKSYMFVRPYIAQCIKREESFICTDPSGELLESMGGYAKEQGYELRVFNLVDPSQSDSWNFIEEVGENQLLAQICVTTIIRNTLEGERGDPFWDNGEKNLLKALLLYVNSTDYTGEKSMGEIYKELSSSEFETTLNTIRALGESHPAKQPYNIFAQATETVQKSYSSGLATRLQIFQSESVCNMVGTNSDIKSQIDLTLPGQKKCAYFVIMSDQDSTYQLLSSLFFSFLFIKLADFAKKQDGQSLKTRVNVVLDELPSIGTIPDLGRKLATVRKYGVNVVPIIQLISQLDNRYSEAERDEIIGCCDTQIWLGSNDLMSAEVLSQRSGTMTVEVSSKSQSLETLSIGTKMTESVGRRQVLTPDEILRLPLDEAIIVLRGQNVMKVKKFKFDDHPDFEMIKQSPKITISNYKSSKSNEVEIPKSEEPQKKSNGVSKNNPPNNPHDSSPVQSDSSQNTGRAVHRGLKTHN